VTAGIIALAVGAAGAIGFYVRHGSLQREREGLRLSVTELNDRVSRNEKLTIVDLRHPLDVLAAPQLIPGAIPISPNDLENCIGDIPKGAEVVLYCTCPNEETSLHAYRKMKDCGFQHVKVLTGGLPAWKQAKMPLQDLYPELEQQVRRRAQHS
jgi:rhodanese-related sulfurtransferase